jgi:hypothetical protein
MPLQAVVLKEYRCGTSPVSKISDNEDASAPLWNSEILSVKHSPGDTIPEFPKSAGEDVKIVGLPASLAAVFFARETSRIIRPGG